MDTHQRRAERMQSLVSTPSSVSAEFGVLGLLLVSGIAGVVTQNATLTATCFLGGLGVWLLYTLPQFLADVRKSKAGDAAKAVELATVAKEAALTSAKLPSPAEALALIQRRRSVYPKDYTGGKVPKEQIQQLLEAARWAPTHGMTEPWRFVVLEGESKTKFEDLTIELCGKLLPADKAEKTLEKLNGKRGSTWGKVSAHIAVCVKRQAKPDKLMPEWEEMAAVSCATQNMWLMATSLGLAAYWTSWQEVAREAPEMKAFLGIAPEDRCMGFFTLGLSERIESYRGSRGPIADRVTWMS